MFLSRLRGGGQVTITRTASVDFLSRLRGGGPEEEQLTQLVEFLSRLRGGGLILNKREAGCGKGCEWIKPLSPSARAPAVTGRFSSHC